MSHELGNELFAVVPRSFAREWSQLGWKNHMLTSTYGWHRCNKCSLSLPRSSLACCWTLGRKNAGHVPRLKLQLAVNNAMAPFLFVKTDDMHFFHGFSLRVWHTALPGLEDHEKLAKRLDEAPPNSQHEEVVPYLQGWIDSAQNLDNRFWGWMNFTAFQKYVRWVSPKLNSLWTQPMVGHGHPWCISCRGVTDFFGLQWWLAHIRMWTHTHTNIWSIGIKSQILMVDVGAMTGPSTHGPGMSQAPRASKAPVERAPEKRVDPHDGVARTPLGSSIRVQFF